MISSSGLMVERSLWPYYLLNSMILCCLCDVENNIENKTIFFNIDKNKERKRGIFCSSRFFIDFLVLFKEEGREKGWIFILMNKKEKPDQFLLLLLLLCIFYFLKWEVADDTKKKMGVGEEKTKKRGREKRKNKK